MKKLLAIIFGLLTGLQMNAQLEEKCIPSKLIVAAENLNFRAEPNTKSEPIGKLNTAETLTLIELIKEKDGGYWSRLSTSWIKVRRDKTGEIGFVFGKYVKPQEMAYINYHDTDRLQKGNWYGIFEEDGKVKIERANPKIIEEAGFKSINSIDKHKIIICSQDKINEGVLNGKLFFDQNEYLKVGINKQLLRIGKNKYSLVCTGEVTLKPPILMRKNEKVIFMSSEMDGPRRIYRQQDLTDCIFQYGEVGYQIHFIGDLNNDGVPELIISEGSNHGGTVYYFRSNEMGELELQSITGISSKC